MAKRRFVNADTTLTGASSQDVPLDTPDGLHWLWVFLTASYSGALVPGLSITSRYQMNDGYADDGTKSVALVVHPADLNNSVPIIGGDWAFISGAAMYSMRGVNPFIQLDRERLMVRYNAAPASRTAQIRGVVWESKDLQELLCIAAGNAF